MSINTEEKVQKGKRNPSIISEGKITSIILSLFNYDSIAKRKALNSSIAKFLELLPEYPKPADLTSVEDKERFKKERSKILVTYKDKYLLLKKLERESLEKKDSNKKDLSQSEIDERKRKYNDFVSNLSKIDNAIFNLYNERKSLSKGTTRIGKNVAKIISEFVREVVRDIFEHSLKHLNLVGMKKLQNKYVFGPNMVNNKYYPLYQNLSCIKEFQALALKELDNDCCKSQYNKEKASYNKTKKDKPATKIAPPTDPTFHNIKYDTTQPPIKFVGAIGKIWTTFKKDYMCTEITRECLSRFVYDFIVNLVKALKVQLEVSEVLTFQAHHVMILLKSLGTLHEIDMAPFLSDYEPQKIKEKKQEDKKENKEDEEKGNEEDNDNDNEKEVNA